MAGPLSTRIVVAVFLLEIDVTLSIFDHIQNEYTAFTSCGVAGRCVDVLFFVARDLSQRHSLLMYGVSCVLIFFGFEMLVLEVYHIPDVMCMLMIIIVMALCILLLSCSRPTLEQENETDEVMAAKQPPLGNAGWPAAQDMQLQ